MKVLYAVAEAYPFLMTGGLGDVAGALPKAIRQNGVDCRVVLPLHSDISGELKSKLTYLTNFNLSIGWRKQYCGIFEAHMNDTIYYLLDNEYYFNRSGIYGHYDDGERFAFFSGAILEMLRHIEFKPDIIHSNDWHTALVPVYRNLLYGDMEEYKHLKTVFTIHNILYQGQFGTDILTDALGLQERDLMHLEYKGCINLMKAAIAASNAVTTVSPGYARELKDPYYANGLEYVINEYSYKISGILNGIDTILYNPETDEQIAQTYSVNDITGKSANKANLQELLQLPVDDSVPVMAMVTRLVGHKGLDLVNRVLDTLLSHPIQLIILGKGEAYHEDFLLKMAAKYPDKLSVTLGFLPDLAKKIYAGADLFLMPSQSEPCGLSQMVSLRYGTIPIVRETGGLGDTITDCGDGMGNGFTFKTYHELDMLDAISRAEALYSEKEEWEILIKRAMTCDFSWRESAKAYIQLYQNLIN